jgi:hypothetical protein
MSSVALVTILSSFLVSAAKPAPRVDVEHEFTRGEVSERSIEAVLKHARMT